MSIGIGPFILWDDDWYVGRCLSYASGCPGNLWRGAGPLIDQFLLDGVMGQLRIVFHPHFFEDAGSIGADGFDAE